MRVWAKSQTFFYDEGKMVRSPEKLVRKNLTGIMAFLEERKEGTDFFLLQEVDRAADRSAQTDQLLEIAAKLPDFTYAFGQNYLVSYIPIPILEPMGSVSSGLANYSRYMPVESFRGAYQGNYDWPTYLFFLDRCFLLMRYEVKGGKELVVINTHNSAFDDGSLKKKQMEQLKTVLMEEYEKGNYVVVGGDWNQHPPDYHGFELFPIQKKPENAYLFVPSSYPASGWQWVYDPSIPTNRSLSAPFDPDTTQRSIIDFFLLSPNIELKSVKAWSMDFEFSDHQPVGIEIKLR